MLLKVLPLCPAPKKWQPSNFCDVMPARAGIQQSTSDFVRSVSCLVSRVKPGNDRKGRPAKTESSLSQGWQAFQERQIKKI
jgi:hypothetical protein